MTSAEAPAPKKATPLLRKPSVMSLLIIALLAEIGYAVLNISTMPVYLKNDRGLGESVIGFVLVAFLFSEAVFKSPMGHFADRKGRKLLMTLGPALSVATSLLTLAVPHNGGAWEVLAFLLLRMLDGLGAAMLWPAAFAAMGDAVDDDERQQAMSLLNLCYMLGIALALPIGGVVNDLSGAKWASLILSALLFTAVAVGVWRLVPVIPIRHHVKVEPPAPLEEVEIEGIVAAAVLPHHIDVEGEPGGELSLKDFITSFRQIPGFLLLSIVTFAGIGFPMPIIKLFAQDEFGMSESQFGALVFPAAIAMAILSVPMSRYGERIGRPRAVHFGMGLCALGLSAIAAGAVIPWLRQPWIMAVAGIPVGIGFLMAIPAWMASVSDIDSRRRAANLGAVMTAQGIGAIIGAPIGGALYEKLTPLGISLGLGQGFAHYAPFVGCAFCVTLGWLLSLRVLSAKPREEGLKG